MPEVDVAEVALGAIHQITSAMQQDDPQAAVELFQSAKDHIDVLLMALTGLEAAPEELPPEM